ncbi:MAG: hypothetical protein QOC81_2898 [Thermoanaerobaculia bacterium]|jgi:hypothetical protein|nr:hypothetical protein [Thermoanaerobaculia bacterium]
MNDHGYREPDVREQKNRGPVAGDCPRLQRAISSAKGSCVRPYTGQSCRRRNTEYGETREKEKPAKSACEDRESTTNKDHYRDQRNRRKAGVVS